MLEGSKQNSTNPAQPLARFNSLKELFSKKSHRCLQDRKSYARLFQDVANLLFNETLMVVVTDVNKVLPNSTNDRKVRKLMSYFQASEIEFYMNDFLNHQDTFTLQFKSQNKAGKWLFEAGKESNDFKDRQQMKLVRGLNGLELTMG